MSKEDFYAGISAKLDEIERRLRTLEGSSELANVDNTNKLIVAKLAENNQAIMAVVEQSISKKIQSVVMPEIRKTMDYVRYKTDDGEELTDAYRREVAKNDFGLIDGQLALEGAVKDKRHIMPHVQTLFADEPDSADDSD